MQLLRITGCPRPSFFFPVQLASVVWYCCDVFSVRWDLRIVHLTGAVSHKDFLRRSFLEQQARIIIFLLVTMECASPPGFHGPPLLCQRHWPCPTTAADFYLIPPPWNGELKLSFQFRSAFFTRGPAGKVLMHLKWKRFKEVCMLPKIPVVLLFTLENVTIFFNTGR